MWLCECSNTIKGHGILENMFVYKDTIWKPGVEFSK